MMLQGQRDPFSQLVNIKPVWACGCLESQQADCGISLTFSCIDTKGVKQFLLSVCVSITESQAWWLEGSSGDLEFSFKGGPLSLGD